MKSIRVGIATVLMVVMLTACAALASPKTFDEKLAYADGTLTAVLNATTASLEAQQISSKDARSVRDLARQAAGFTDAARAATSESEKATNLELATSVLSQLQAYLAKRSK